MKYNPKVSRVPRRGDPLKPAEVIEFVVWGIIVTFVYYFGEDVRPYFDNHSDLLWKSASVYFWIMVSMACLGLVWVLVSNLRELAQFTVLLGGYWVLRLLELDGYIVVLLLLLMVVLAGPRGPKRRKTWDGLW